MKIEYTPIENGQYTININLNEYRKELEQLQTEVNKTKNQDHFVSSFDQGILKYKSETLLPERAQTDKPKLLFVFGNPATHSIINGMFFFSRTDLGRHSMWGKLAKAGVIKQITSDNHNAIEARREEAEKRKKMILNSKASSRYSIGLTTFYSFPTPAEGGVRKVEDLFAPILGKLEKQETKL